MRTLALMAVSSLAFAGAARAQSFNVDLGEPASAAGVVSSRYGGAAHQPGGGDAVTDNTLTLGDDQALLDDAMDPSNGDTLTFAGLANGDYEIYCYAWAPDQPTYVTMVAPSGGVASKNCGGAAWTGSHVEGVTYVKFLATITTGSISFTFTQPVSTDFATCNGFQFVALDDNLSSFCNGDGGVSLGCPASPCGNNAPAGTTGGCLNSNGTSARLIASGVPDVSTPADTLHFDLVGGTFPGSFGVLISGDNQLPNAGACPPGSGITSATLDGLRCVGGAAQRHGSRSLGTMGSTSAGWGPPANPTAGIGVTSGFVAGQTRHFQCFYRETPTLGCMTGQNTSNGISVTFQ